VWSQLWDAQIVPFVRAARWHGATVTTLELDYSHPTTMKTEEEGVSQWGEKRLLQVCHAPPPRATATRPARSFVAPLGVPRDHVLILPVCWQLNFLFKHVAGALREPAPPT
jgi:hypothetical protein